MWPPTIKLDDHRDGGCHRISHRKLGSSSSKAILANHTEREREREREEKRERSNSKEE